MSTHSPRLQFVTGLFDSPKTEAKGVILVKGPWNETLGFPGLFFFFLSEPVSFVPRFVSVMMYPILVCLAFP